MKVTETSKQNFEKISSLVNSTAFRPEEVAELLSHDHRYLQSEFFKMAYAFIRKLAANKKNYRFDQRNRWAAEMAEKMIDGLGPDFAITQDELEYSKQFV